MREKDIKESQIKKSENIKSRKEGGAGIVNEEARKEDEIIHKGRPGEIDGEEN